MKNTAIINLTFFMCLIFLTINIDAQDIIVKNDSTNTKAQKVKALSIVYDITYPAKKPLFESKCFNSGITLMQGSKALSKAFTEYGDISTFLSYDCNVTAFQLMPDLPILIKGTAHDFFISKEVITKTTITNETKQILGFTCKKVKFERKINAKTLTSYYYVYESKNPNYCSNSIETSYIGINGLMLGCELDCSLGAIQVWTAKSISEEVVDSSVFDIPSNYSVMTFDEYIQKITTDKVFRKQFLNGMRYKDKTEDGKKAFRREIWNSLPKDLMEVAIQGTQQFEASQQFQNNPNSQTLNNYANVVNNNNTLSSADAMKANNEILANSTASNTGNSQINSESSASTNGGNFNKNAGAAKKCSDDTQSQWKGTTEYNNYIKNPSCNKMAYISQKKLVEMLLQSCRQYLPQAEIEGFNKTISSLETTINGMEDCKTFN